MCIILFFFLLVTALAKDLHIETIGPFYIGSLSDLVITTTLINRGSTPLVLLRTPGSILFPNVTNNFDIVHEYGGSPRFLGAQMKYSLDILAANNGSFLTLPPNTSLNITHDLSNLYDFSSTGKGIYHVHPARTLYEVSSAGGIPKPFPAGSFSSHSINLIEDVFNFKEARLENKLERRDTVPGDIVTPRFKSCSTEYQDATNDAIPIAKKYVADAVSYLATLDDSTPRFTTWFGDFTTHKYNFIQRNYEMLNATDAYQSWTYDCGCEEGNAGIIAYVYGPEYGTIHLCPGFMAVGPVGTDSRAGSLIHESTHWAKTVNTLDYVYGQEGCKSLAEDDWRKAVRNADTYEYFAENVPELL
ncbi:hypothetical protein M422DRAFT_783363 [Sphaerobolus stellatus SS14]|uniref:Lysine-specific metallo-endopeptidase domain-containing protein n=1 Tax=Sphaerobolus stellatus (strain SS14) TaxID=990650 RepID=A0A0C9UTY1_SPHS4|nr:hypothetical protein M422DRAFT_783363 [Sphaerobolus stellatus SS14]